MNTTSTREVSLDFNSSYRLITSLDFSTGEHLSNRESERKSVDDFLELLVEESGCE